MDLEKGSTIGQIEKSFEVCYTLIGTPLRLFRVLGLQV